MEDWSRRYLNLSAIGQLLLASSIMLSLKFALRGSQLLLLTGKAYICRCESMCGALIFHIGNEANDLFENTLYAAMFYISQILLPWGCSSSARISSSTSLIEPFLMVAIALTYWELNPL